MGRLLVLDIDTTARPDAGICGPAALDALAPIMPPTVAVETGSGGLHLSHRNCVHPDGTRRQLSAVAEARTEARPKGRITPRPPDFPEEDKRHKNVSQTEVE